MTKESISVKEKVEKSYEVMSKTFGYKNKLASPKIIKVSVSVATGSAMKKDRKKNEFISDRLTKITGQKPVIRKAKQSNASFKIRQGDAIGVSVSLRGKRMFAFLDKLINLAIPRTKDFRGIERKTIDNMGNMTFGIKEHTIFPEIKDEEIKDVFGMAITIVTTAKSKDEAEKLLEIIDIPFKKK
ncbi:MAG: 50S ribosomal protein L5 [Cyanobium sp. MAG06]|nr:50S ribosomal protein L5 [Cyanobium sp. MAG06]